MKILNTWKSDEAKKYYFDVEKPIATYEDYAVYKLADKDFLYTYKNIAVNELVVYDAKYFDVLSGKDQTYGSAKEFLFLLDRADKTKAKGELLMQ